MWKPLGASLTTIVIVLAVGITRWFAVLGFWLVSLVFYVTLYEFWKGMRARRKRHGEGALAALWNLVKKNRRRYGGYIIHIGVIVMALGVIGIEMFQTETQGTIPRGKSLSLAGYTVTYEDLATFDTNDGRNVARAEVSVSRNGREIAELYPRRDFYYDSNQPMTIPGVRSTVAGDLYILLVDWKEISESGATFKIYHNPLVKWLWIGGFVFIGGVFIAAWPEKEPVYVRQVSPAPSKV